MKLIVGLGNPGKKYEYTRHNVGFMVVDELSFRHQTPWSKTKFKGMVSRQIINREVILLVKPLTFMNLSGECVRAIIDYYNIPTENLLVIYDDMNLPVGKIRLRKKGSAGGHNGIKSLVQHLKTQEFNRIRIGIGRPEREDVLSYVLGDFTKMDQPIIIDAIKQSASAVEHFAAEPFSHIMNKYN